jgi:hypothetical protein
MLLYWILQATVTQWYYNIIIILWDLECCRNYNDMYQDIHSKPQTHEIEMDNNWNQVKVRHNKSSKSNNSNLIQLILCSSNKYEILHNLEENEIVWLYILLILTI